MTRNMDKSVGQALTRAARMHRTRMGQLLAEIGLFPGQEQVIETLSQNGEMTVGALARALGVKAPTASKALARLETQGLIARANTGEDARVTLVGLTDLGRMRAEGLSGLWQTVEDEMMDDLDSKERKRLRKTLRRAARNLASASRAQDEPDEAGEDADED